MQVSRPVPATGSATNDTVAPSSENTGPNHQTRRLQLRNAGFRGHVLPIRRISPILSASISPSESFARIVSNENSPQNLEKRQLYGEDVPPSPVNILQELHNSARRKRHSARKSVGEIFQDNTARDADRELSWYSETSNNNSPLASRKPSTIMSGLREVSINVGSSPPSSSPLAKQARARKGNRVRSTSAEAAKYIEHLESQLVAVNTKLDSLMSPTSHKARAAKLRGLTSEARLLRQQVSEWEQKFDERVKDERNQLAEVEMSLASRLQALEDEVETKDNRVRELEWEMGNLKMRIRDAEGLEAVNTDLERRIDLLTNLLVTSPTKLDLCSATTSPSKPDPRIPAARPRSMIPKIPPSPGSMRLSLNIDADVRFRRSRRSIASASSASRSPGTGSVAKLEHDQQAIEGMRQRKDSSDLSSGHSSSFRSPPLSSSRPTSFHSSSSLGAYSWGLPLSPEAGGQGCKQRRMRRFPPGAASLKPLILPTAAATPSLPASAPARDTVQESPERKFSNTSLDPTIAFLSRHDFSSPITTPTQPGRKRSATNARTETLYALEGHRTPSMDHGDVSPHSCSDEPLETVQEESLDARLLKGQRPRSLGEELEQVGLLFQNPSDEELVPDLDQDRWDGLGMNAQRSVTPDHSVVVKSSSEAGDQSAPVKLTAQSPISSTTAILTPHTYGLFSRLRGLLLQTKQDPAALAQRLVHNAWVLGMAKLGGVGWWLLGLVYRSRWRKRKRAADPGTTVEIVPTRGMEWHHFSPGKNPLRDPPEHSKGLCSVDPHRNHKSPDGPQHFGQVSPRSPSSRYEPHLVPCPDYQEPSSRRCFRLWFRFSLAIVLAVGIAIKDGPGALLEDDVEHNAKLDDIGQLMSHRVRRMRGEAPHEP